MITQRIYDKGTLLSEGLKILLSDAEISQLVEEFKEFNLEHDSLINQVLINLQRYNKYRI